MGAERESIRDAISLIKYAHSYKNGDHESGYKHHLFLIKKHKLKYLILKSPNQINTFIKKTCKEN